ncbi:nuclease-related domain-containing DEAD/DEAH box helicase [Coleofasciculus sp. FACHB-501]|uniref:DEAD/DEAH box helicase n=1 Tax=Cyanophyceae TaxID=3028117 RepID=UPI001688E6E9|nr:nuclease-related domain-containing DEAD/DEAH box helicase [Coleofasciculus sp. FACHB-501]MBD1836646.1 NERD domain-containing protein [Coleofasciculus sp. FACHB-501]
MALMVPDFVPSKASQGEKRLYKTLHYELPDDCHVWYEPRVKGLYPDFIILGPTLGLLVLEVKGWEANQIISANNQFFEIQNGTKRPERQQSPLRQGKSYLDAILDKLKQYPILTQPDGDYQGKLTFPVGVGVVMTNLTLTQAHSENIYSLLEQPQVAYRDELMDWDGIGERELTRRLESMFTTRFKFLALTDDQISTIKGILHPETVIKQMPATSKSVPSGVKPAPDSSVIVTLDIEQERLAADIRDGHRLFYGVAGSGKTLILLSRAKLLANRLLGHRVLVLCFNITLAAYLRSLIHDESQNPLYKERIEVTHFNGWARTILGRLPNPQQVTGDYDEVLGERLLEAIADFPLEKKWDAILVDEAHTFSPNWFRCCVAALKDPENGDLMIVADGSQSLYERSKFTWSSVEIKAVGRTKKLPQNYRNTQEILSAAWSIVQPFQTEDEQEEVTFPTVEPSAALRTGERSVLHLTTSRVEEIEAVIAQIQKLHASGYDPKDIAVVYRYLTQSDTPLFNKLQQQLNDLGLGYYWVTENKGSYSNQRTGVRLITALSSLGLEFKAVLIPWVQQFGDRYSREPEAAALARRQLYVAMTRAQEQLHLFGSGDIPILDELRQSEHFEVIDCNAILVS